MEEVNGIKGKATTHYLYRIIGKRPNSWMTASEFWGMAIVHISLRGNFYAFKYGIPGQPIKMLVPIAPDAVQNVVQNPDYSITYHINTGSGEVKKFSQSQIMHIRGLTTKGVVGLNPIECAREAVGLGLASETFLSKWFGKGMHPGAILKHPLTLSAQAHSNIKKNFKEKYAGLGNSHDFMVIDEGMGIEFPPIKLVDAQFIELERFNEAQICGMFGIPLILVQAGSTPATYASSVQFKQSFVDFTIAPIAVNIESAIDRDCLSESEQDRYYSKFNMGALLRGNMAERFAAYAIAIDKEFMNPNQARQFEDWNGYGPEGDEYRTRTSSMKQDDSAKDTEKDTEQDKGSDE
jgi:HK97 family phage portal protein